jgi:hypothetical protein
MLVSAIPVVGKALQVFSAIRSDQPLLVLLVDKFNSA